MQLHSCGVRERGREAGGQCKHHHFSLLFPIHIPSVFVSHSVCEQPLRDERAQVANIIMDPFTSFALTAAARAAANNISGAHIIP